MLPALLAFAVLVLCGWVFLVAAPLSGPSGWPSNRTLDRARVEWRKDSLRLAELHSMDLSGLDLSHAVLDDATITGTNLRMADLTGASLRGAHLGRRMHARRGRGSFWLETDLRGARLSSADLRGADFRGALLEGAVLSGAVFDRATRWPDGFDPIQAGAIAADEPRVTRADDGPLEAKPPSAP